MLLSLGLIILIGLIIGEIFKKLRLPGLIGMLLTGIILGPFGLNLLDKNILLISADLRQIALIIILLKAGLSLDISDLKKVGKSAVLLSFLPASFEILAYFLFARLFFNISPIDSLLMGSVLAAVSPAVVVPRMVKLIEEKRGVRKSIPQMILAGASCDDIFVLVLFSTFLAMAKGDGGSLMSLVNVPISIVLGILLGGSLGYVLERIFEFFYKKDNLVRNSLKVIVFLGFSFLLVSLEEKLKGVIPISGLLAIISIACIYKLRTDKNISSRLSEKFGKIWLFAEIILFVLVGAEVDISYLANIGKLGFIMIFLALIFRSFATFISVKSAKLNKKETIFTLVSYIPKATVQAAIGAVPLANGLYSGNVILSMAVLGIIVTAPLGAIFIDNFYNKLLD